MLKNIGNPEDNYGNTKNIPNFPRGNVTLAPNALI